MTPNSVFSSRRPVRATGSRAVARFLPSLLAAVLTLPAVGSLRAQVPGTPDPAFQAPLSLSTVYATIFESGTGLNNGNSIFAAGDIGFLDANLYTDGTARPTIIQPVYGGASTRIVFTAVEEQVPTPNQLGKSILLGGFFGLSEEQIVTGAPAQNIFRINPEGAVDTGFLAGVGAGANNYVTSILPLAHGKIVVGGLFTTFNLETRLRIVRLNSGGSLDESFSNSSAIDGDVLALAEAIGPVSHAPNNSIYVAGNFNHVGGQSVTKLARLDADGNLDPTFKPVIDTRVIAIVVQPSGQIVIGGEFTNVNGTAVSRIARLNYDGSLDTTFTTSVSGAVPGEPNPVAVYVLKQLSPAGLGKIYIGGNFTQINGSIRRYLGAINPSGTLGAYDPGTNIYDKVQSITVQPNGRLLIGETLGPKIGKTFLPSLIRLFGATTVN